MKIIKKITAAALTLLLLSGIMPLTVFAEEKDSNERKVTIFVDGINSEDIIDVNTGDTVWPPQTSKIVSAVAETLPSLTEFLFTNDIEKLKEPLVNAVVDVLSDSACDQYGHPAANTTVDWEYPTKEEILETIDNPTVESRIKFTFDWRLDMKTLAGQLHDFIEYVMEAAEVESVDMIAFSMGTAVAATYLKIYDYEYIDGIVFLSGGFLGSSCCGEPFSDKLGVDGDATTRFTESVILNTDEELDDIIINEFMHQINKAGITDKLLDYIYSLAEELSNAIYSDVFANTFATFPGMWALVPDVDYENAKALVCDSMTDEFVETIDWYHYEIQSHLTDILQGCLDRSINFGIIAQYGYGMFPCIESYNSMSDSVIDTKYESVGATVADIGSDLGKNYIQKIDNGHNCISPDNMIDSSTCAFCDYTWFIKNSRHGENRSGYMTICRYILDAEKQVTVWNEDYPQYVIIEDGVPVPLTTDNCQNEYTDDLKNETIGERLKQSFSDMISAIKYMIKTLKEKLEKFVSQFSENMTDTLVKIKTY